MNKSFGNDLVNTFKTYFTYIYGISFHILHHMANQLEVFAAAS